MATNNLFPVGTVYLGDGVYAHLDPQIADTFWLKTSDGISITNKICLDLAMLETLKEFLKVNAIL